MILLNIKKRYDEDGLLYTRYTILDRWSFSVEHRKSNKGRCPE